MSGEEVGGGWGGAEVVVEGTRMYFGEYGGSWNLHLAASLAYQGVRLEQQRGLGAVMTG